MTAKCYFTSAGYRLAFLCISTCLLLIPADLWAGNSLADYTAYPPFLTAQTPPNVIIALDVSGSMKLPAYTEAGIDWRTGVQTNFSPHDEYFGYFDQDSRYGYDTQKQFFFADSAGQWDGNFLNWATTRRIDVARKLIAGGRVSVVTRDSDRNSPTYKQIVSLNRNKARMDQNWQQDWDGWYIIEGQNEPYDGQFYKRYHSNSSGGHTPLVIGDDKVFQVSQQRLIPQQDVAVNAFALSAQIEVGTLAIKLRKGEEWHWVPFVNSYNQPRVVVTSATANGRDPLSAPIIRLQDGLNDGFYVRLQEWDYLDGEHGEETLSYLVVESKSVAGAALGCLDIEDEQGAIWQFCAEADSQPVSSQQCGVSGYPGVVAQQINWDAPLPNAKPLVFTGLRSRTAAVDSDALAVRSYFPAGRLDRSFVQVTIQEQEEKGGASSCDHETVEQVSAIAVVPPKGMSAVSVGRWNYGDQQIKLQAGILRGVSQDWTELNNDSEQPFSQSPFLLTAIQSQRENDPATLRTDFAEGDNGWRVEMKIDEEQSLDNETSHRAEEVGWLAVEVVTGYAIRIGVREEPIGLLQKSSGSMRLGLAVYNYDHQRAVSEIYTDNQVNGGTLYPCYPDPQLPMGQRTTTDICLPTGVHDPLANSLRVVEEYPLLWGTTPLAETLLEIGHYLRQSSPTGDGYYDDKSPKPSYPFGLENDPYYSLELGAKMDCAKSFVLHFTDGTPERDWDGAGQPSLRSDGIGPSGENEMLDAVAALLRREDLRPDAELSSHQEVVSYYVLAAFGGDGDEGSGQDNNASRRLREAAINGAFFDQDGDHRPDPQPPGDVNQYLIDHIDPLTGQPDCRDKINEWDRNGDCNPDGFYLAKDGFALEKQLEAAFMSIGKRSSSGTAAAVVASSRSGAGAIYQALFYPHYDDRQGHTLQWSGQLQALLIDDYGNLREDTNGNDALDLAEDLMVVFDRSAEDGAQVTTYRDGIVQSDGSVGKANGRLDPDELAAPVAVGDPDSLKYLWQASDWLNRSELQPVSQRNYRTASQERYVFTFVDDGDLLATSGEVVAFTAANRALLAPYLHLSEPFRYSANHPPAGVNKRDYPAFQDHQAARLINWVRGQDQAAFTFGDSSLPAMRSRAYQYQAAGQLFDGTWRLGDIIHSTPTVVGRPAEDLDLLYRDRSYVEFYQRYKDRRNVIYVGANDGMFHAFNAGFYDAATHSYQRLPRLANGKADNRKNSYELGSEIWAYIPHNLLPHLHWLTDPDYTHVYYNDLKPKVFDARVFLDDDRHPNGWGTLLVTGMRLGGGAIYADLNHNGRIDGDDKLMRSAFCLFDVTDPEEPPVLLAEIALPGLGYSTSYPVVVRVEDDSGGTYGASHYLLFGSGPAGVDGLPDRQALEQFASRQPGRMFMLHLNRLTDDRQQLCFVTASGACAAADSRSPYLMLLENKSLVSEPISVDWDLDYGTDAVYFGTVNGSAASGWGGSFRRIVVDNDPDSSRWDTENLFLDLSPGEIEGSADGNSVSSGQPISAAPTAGLEENGHLIERWLFFGTGRFLSSDDNANGDQQSFYGLKEPKDVGGNWSYATLRRNADLLDVSQGQVYARGAAVSGLDGIGTFEQLLAQIFHQHGWLMDLPDFKERSISQATLLGSVLTFASFVPQQQSCSGAGQSLLYALDYRAGTASSKQIFGAKTDERSDSDGNTTEDEPVKKRQKVGEGIASSPGIHTGREEGTKVVIQTSGGAIITVKQESLGPNKSGVTAWEVED